MKIWMAMMGGQVESWDLWAGNVSHWLKNTMTSRAVFADNHCRMAEFEYQYKSVTPMKAGLSERMGPIAIDGWLRHSSQHNSSNMFGKEALMSVQQQLVRQPVETLRACKGDFTLCVFDAARGRLHMATDIYATRPIYYWIGPHSELFVSNDLRALLHVDHIPFEVDYDRCLMYLSSQYCIGENTFAEETFFKGIKKLPAAASAVWDGQNLNRTIYWGIDDLTQLPLIQQDAVPMFRQLLIDCVQERLYKSKSIMEVSGGLDSAAVLAAAVASDNQHKMLGVNISFSSDDMIQSNDRGIVRKMFENMNLPGIIILGDNTLGIANAEQGRDPLWYIDGPDPRANVLVNETYNAIGNVFQTDVGLTGEGGDFLFSGESYAVDSLLRQRKFSQAFQTLWKWSDRKLGKAIKLGASYGIAPFLPYFTDSMYYQLAWAEGDNEMPDYFTKTHLTRERQSRRNEYERLKQSKPLKHWGRRYHYDYMFPRASYLDAVGVSMQNLHPFYDRRIIEFALSVPTEQHYDTESGKIDNYYGSKQLIRKAFTDILPKFLYDRVTKTSYAHMSRKSLLNERSNLLSMFGQHERLFVHELEVVDKNRFRDHLLGTLIRTSDINNDLGMPYQYLRAIIEMEIWLKEMSRGKEAVLERAKPRDPRWLADIETVGDVKEFESISIYG